MTKSDSTSITSRRLEPDYAELAERLQPIMDKIWAASATKEVQGRTITLKLKFSDFVQVTRLVCSEKGCLAEQYWKR